MLRQRCKKSLCLPVRFLLCQIQQTFLIKAPFLLLLPQLLQPVHFPSAESPAGQINHPQKCVVIAVGNQLQICQNIQNHSSLIKADSPEYLIGDILLHQLLLHHPGQKAGSIDNRKIRIPKALLLPQAPDIVNDLIHLLRLVSGMIMNHGSALGIPCKQILLQAHLIFFYQGVCALENLGRGSIVLIQDNGLCRLVLLVEVHQQLYVGSSPFIDILIRIPHNHEISIHSGQDLYQPHLHGRAVLKLVHHDIVQPALPLLPHLRVRLQQIDGEGDKVVEIQRIGCFLPLQKLFYNLIVLILYFAHDPARLRIAHLPHILHVLLRPPDLSEHGLKSGVVKLQLMLLVYLLQHALLLVGIDDLKLLVEKQLLGILPQQLVAEPVIGAYQAYIIPLPNQPPDPSFHLSCRLVGAGHA